MNDLIKQIFRKSTSESFRCLKWSLKIFKSWELNLSFSVFTRISCSLFCFHWSLPLVDFFWGTPSGLAWIILWNKSSGSPLQRVSAVCSSFGGPFSLEFRPPSPFSLVDFFLFYIYFRRSFWTRMNHFIKQIFRKSTSEGICFLKWSLKICKSLEVVVPWSVLTRIFGFLFFFPLLISSLGIYF